MSGETAADVLADIRAMERQVVELKARARRRLEDWYRLRARELRAEGKSIGEILHEIDWPKNRSYRQVETWVKDINVQVGCLETVKPGRGFWGVS